jgi:hypothetical protein
VSTFESSARASSIDIKYQLATHGTKAAAFAAKAKRARKPRDKIWLCTNCYLFLSSQPFKPAQQNNNISLPQHTTSEGKYPTTLANCQILLFRLDSISHQAFVLCKRLIPSLAYPEHPRVHPALFFSANGHILTRSRTRIQADLRNIT